MLSSNLTRLIKCLKVLEGKYLDDVKFDSYVQKRNAELNALSVSALSSLTFVNLISLDNVCLLIIYASSLIDS